MFAVREDDLSDERSRSLLALHLRGMHDSSPAGHVHALDLASLQTSGVTVWSAWEGERIASIGALKLLDAEHAEIKSMRTHPEFARRGAASAVLERIIAAARAQGVRRLSLETGSGDSFEAALSLYRRRGFVSGGAFGGYHASTFNQFLHLDLEW